MRVRGLKFFAAMLESYRTIVAPHAGAWIEIFTFVGRVDDLAVAPHAGAWIEMAWCISRWDYTRGAPHAGAWIEIDAW